MIRRCVLGLVLLLTWVSPASAAITVFGVASTPADNGAQAGPTVTVTPPPNMESGDFVIVAVQYFGGTAGDVTTQPLPTISPDEYGGQAWSMVREPNGTTNVRVRMFWCQFNGTWSASPSWSVVDANNVVDPTQTAALSALMVVFRPSAASKFFIPDLSPEGNSANSFAAATTVTITGVTTTKASTASLAVWAVPAANTWGTLTGTGWSKAGLSAQYRNTSGSGQSLTAAYEIQTSAGATNNVSQTQSASTGGAPQIMTFAEIDLPSGGSGTLAVPPVRTSQNQEASGTSTIAATIMTSIKTITYTTAAAPIVVTTSTAHGFSVGQTVHIDEVQGMPAADGTWTVTTPITSTTFALQGSDGTGQTYTSNGLVGIPTAVNSGDGIVGFVHWEDTNIGLVNITDDQNNEYIIVQTLSDNALTQSWVAFLLPNITNGPKTITATFNGLSGPCGIMVHEITGKFALDQYNGRYHHSVDSFSPATVSMGSMTTTDTGDYVVGFYNGGDHTLPWCNFTDPSVAWAPTKEIEVDISLVGDHCTADKIQAAAGAIDANIFINPDSDQLYMAALALKPVVATTGNDAEPIRPVFRRAEPAKPGGTEVASKAEPTSPASPLVIDGQEYE